MLIKEPADSAPLGRRRRLILEFRSWLQKLARLAKTFKHIWSALKQREAALARGLFHHFPAIHLKRKLDTWDYAVNFSSELLATGLVILVAACTIAVFGFGKSDHVFSDNSLASRLLSYHTALNPQLYNKENSIKTVVVKQDGFISQALASDDPLSANDPTNSDSGNSNDDSSIDDSGISAPSPDSVRDLLSKQVTFYVSQPGDTLGSIARKFNISIDTIKWANRLPDNSMKPGWNLKILPVDGVLYQATSNDTWPDVCKYFSAANCDAVIAYNGKANAEDIQQGDWLIIPGGTIPAPKPPAPGKKAGNPLPHGHIPAGSGHSFPWGYCTYYVASKVKITFGGNAKAWLGNARAAGYATGSKPAPGSVFVSNESARYGHVGLVQSVSATGITVTEMNYDGFGKVDTRFIPFDSGVIRGYIYTK